MSVLGFVFLIIITVFINVFVTAFLVARSQYSQKVLNRLRSEAHSIIKTVNKATEEHITIAESTIEDLKKLLSQQKRSSRAKKPRQSKSDIPLVSSTKHVKKSHDIITKKNIFQSQESTQNAILKMLKDGKSEAYIKEQLSVSKAEVTLAQFIYKSKK